MKKILFIPILMLIVSCCGTSNKTTKTDTQNFYAFKAENIQGQQVDMKSYSGKVVLVVNTASKCGYTPQFEGLEELYKKYKDEGLVIMGFPCNQFKSQDPGTNEEILEFCTANYGVSFPMFSKIDVNGEQAHPLYTYLKNHVPETEAADIKWNFTKFLIGKDGNPIKRYEPKVTPAEMEDDIRSALKADV